jgi:hypothetical protein
MASPAWRAYFSLDPRSLAAFRIGLGSLVFADFVERARQLEAHYTDAGLLPREALRAIAAHPIYSFHMLDGSAAFQVALFAVSCLAAASLALGWFTRPAAVVTWLCLFSVQGRNPLLNHGADDFELSMLMWAPFLPLGRAWSIDAWRRGRVGRPHDPRTSPTTPVFSAGTVGLVLQPLMLYAVITVSKFQYTAWTEGRAVYALLHKAHYVRPLGEFALTVPGFPTFATYATIAVEFAIVFLVASPWRREQTRTWGVALNTAFHAMLFAMAKIGWFQPLAVLSALPLLPRSAWDGVPWARAPGSAAGAAATPAVAVADAPERHPALARLAEGLCWAIVVVSLVSVPPSFSREEFRYPEPLASIYRIFRIERRYRMFANMDTTPQGWWVIAGTLDDGSRVDGLRGSREVTLERPRSYRDLLPNDNWQMYWSNVSRPYFARIRPYLAEYVCRRWNRDHHGQERMVSIEIIHVKERAVDPREPIVRKPVTLLRGPCPTGR